MGGEAEKAVKGLIYIGNVKMTPRSTREAPWLFNSLDDAQLFSRISSRIVWAVRSDDLNIYRFYPGGRGEAYPAEVREKWAARGSKKRGTSSGTRRESVFDASASGADHKA